MTKREAMMLEQAGLMCKRKPHHHKSSYSMSTGIARPQMSDVSWAPLTRFYPVPCFPLSHSANGAHWCTDVWLISHWDTMADVPLSAAKSKSRSQALLVPLEVTILCLTSWAELSPIFPSCCWIWEDWFMCCEGRTMDWISSTVCKPALLRC